MQIVKGLLAFGLAFLSVGVRFSGEAVLTADGGVIVQTPNVTNEALVVISFDVMHLCGFWPSDDNEVKVQIMSGQWRAAPILFKRNIKNDAAPHEHMLSVPMDDPLHLNVCMTVTQQLEIFGNSIHTYECGGLQLCPNSLELSAASGNEGEVLFLPNRHFPMSAAVKVKRNVPEPVKISPILQPVQKPVPAKALPVQEPSKDASVQRSSKDVPGQKPPQGHVAVVEPPIDCGQCHVQLCNILGASKNVVEFGQKFTSFCASDCGQCSANSPCASGPLRGISAGCDAQSKRNLAIAMMSQWDNLKAYEEAKAQKLKAYEEAKAQLKARAIADAEAMKLDLLRDEEEAGKACAEVIAGRGEVTQRIGLDPKTGDIKNPTKWQAFKEGCESRSKELDKLGRLSSYKCTIVAGKYRFTYPGAGQGVKTKCGSVDTWYDKQLKGLWLGTRCDHYYTQCFINDSPSATHATGSYACPPRTYQDIFMASCNAVEK